MDWRGFWTDRASDEAPGPAQVLGTIGRLGAGESADGLQALVLLMTDEDLVRVADIVNQAAHDAPDDPVMMNAFELLVGVLEAELEARGLFDAEPWR